MFVTIGIKKFNADEPTVARFTELQRYFESTIKEPKEATSPDRVSKVRERDALAEKLGVPRYAIPRPVEQVLVSAGFSQM